jgi:hypothetical protein
MRVPLPRSWRVRLSVEGSACTGGIGLGPAADGLGRLLPRWAIVRGPALRRTAPDREVKSVDLKVPITINDELGDEVVTANALLNLASGEILRIEYADWDTATQGLPWERKDYEFSSGTLSNAGRDVEFSVEVNRTTGQYAVSANELLEVKMRAAALFAGRPPPDRS